MKKIILLCTVSLLCFFCGCTKNDKITLEKNTSQSVEQNTEKTAKQQSTLNEHKIDNINDEAWRQFLKDYEAWVDDYVEFMTKYKENPTDTSLISDYAQFVTQTAEWAEKAEKYKSNSDNISPEILSEYIETLSRITKKITDIAY